MPFGRNQVTGQTVKATSVLASLKGALWHPHGITLDWSLVSALGSDVVDPDGSRRLSGTKSLRYGQVLTQVTGGEIDTVTITASGGTYTISVNGVATTALAFNANAAAIQAALVALSTVGAGNATVTGTGPFVITFAASLGDVTVTLGVGSLTGGTATLAETRSGSLTKKWGPYDPAATDGRQTLTRGNAVIVEKTVFEKDNLGLDITDHTLIGAVEGGIFWRNRLIATTGSASLANGPTFSNLETLFPMLRYAGNGVV